MKSGRRSRRLQTKELSWPDNAICSRIDHSTRGATSYLQSEASSPPVLFHDRSNHQWRQQTQTKPPYRGTTMHRGITQPNHLRGKPPCRGITTTLYRERHTQLNSLTEECTTKQTSLERHQYNQVPLERGISTTKPP